MQRLPQTGLDGSLGGSLVVLRLPAEGGVVAGAARAWQSPSSCLCGVWALIPPSDGAIQACPAAHLPHHHARAPLWLLLPCPLLRSDPSGGLRGRLARSCPLRGVLPPPGCPAGSTPFPPSKRCPASRQRQQPPTRPLAPQATRHTPAPHPQGAPLLPQPPRTSLRRCCCCSRRSRTATRVRCTSTGPRPRRWCVRSLQLL